MVKLSGTHHMRSEGGSDSALILGVSDSTFILEGGREGGREGRRWRGGRREGGKETQVRSAVCVMC